MKKKKLDIIYEDKYLIIINKPSGILTISRDNSYDKNLYDEVKEYIKKQNRKNRNDYKQKFKTLHNYSPFISDLFVRRSARKEAE